MPQKNTIVHTHLLTSTHTITATLIAKQPGFVSLFCIRSPCQDMTVSVTDAYQQLLAHSLIITYHFTHFFQSTHFVVDPKNIEDLYADLYHVDGVGEGQLKLGVGLR